MLIIAISYNVNLTTYSAHPITNILVWTRDNDDKWHKTIPCAVAGIFSSECYALVALACPVVIKS